MPRITPFRLAAFCALALTLTLALAAGASAKGFKAELRVVGAGSKVLVEKPIATATTTVKTSPKAECFGKGSGGSGDPVTIKGNTAMGVLARASKAVASLRPLLISDSFDFGLALCGIGKSIAKGSSSWYLKVNHKSLPVSGDAAVIHPGDEVLWTLAKTEAPAYKYPTELVLSAPANVKPGVPFTVRVFSYDEKGKGTPAADVKVTGATIATGPDGRTKVTLRKPARLIARADAQIPSAREPVCVGGKCPK
ncbi:MAG TPA: hypothetical protein VGW80_01180 [Solirubrobacterales bacterium]|jgi:hypothetical protein|nr:hypothetical protein [Solirubrobacterales bacterium]